MTVSFSIYGKKVVIPISHGINGNSFFLPPRCEVFRELHLKKINEPVFIDSQEICEGVLISKCIVNSKTPVIRILNTTDEMKFVHNFEVRTENLSNFLVYSINKTSTSNERIENLKSVLIDKMPNYVSEELMLICEKYADIFTLKDDKMTINNMYEQKLRLRDSEPVYVKNYRLPYTQRNEIKRQVQNLLDNDLIEPSTSNYNSPLILVPKKSPNDIKSYRMCVDFRSINKKLIADKFPLPRIDDILDNLGRARHFSILDLFSGFHQIPLHENSRDLTSFSTDQGAFRWKVLPFGLNVAPNSFSRMMSLAFSGLEPNKAFLYIDDIIVIGCSRKHHLKNLTSVFDILRKYNLKINPYKCNFFRPEVTFLGHRCTANGLLPDDTKISAIRKYTVPTDKDAVKRFVAFANYYRRFIPNFASLAAPLNFITRKKVSFVWDDKCQESFENIKAELISPKILQYPDFSKQFLITVDASKVGCGAILSQNFSGHDLPIYYASKAFNRSEQKKPTIEQELIAIYFAINQFRPYVYGTEFVVRTDHRPLVYLFNMKDPSSKLTNIRLKLSEYNFSIEYIKGKNNVGADALSRISIKDLKNDASNILAVTTRAMSKQNDIGEKPLQSHDTVKLKVYDKFSQEFNKKVAKIKSEIFQEDGKITNITLNMYNKFKLVANVNIVNETFNFDKMLLRLQKEANNNNIYIAEWPKNDLFFSIYTIQDLKNHGNRILKTLEIMLVDPIETIIDEDKKRKLLEIYHNDPITGGHCGRKRVYAKLRTKYYWRNMTRTIASFIKECRECSLNKVRKGNREELTLTPTPAKPFDVVVLDTIGPLPTSGYGNKYALTLICDFTKYLVTIPIPDKSAKTVAQAIFENFILIYGKMNAIKSDLGTEFKNEIFCQLCKLLSIEINFSTAYHHQTVGTIERNHRVFNEYIRSYIRENISDWDTYLKYFTFFHNTTSSSVFDNKFTPFELVFGKNAILPNDLNLRKIDPLYNAENYSNEVKYRLQKSHIMTKQLLEKHKKRNKEFYDKSAKPCNLKINDNVFIKKEPYDKFKNIYDGPFIITKINGVNVTVYNKSLKTEKTIHKDRLRIAN